MKVHLSTRFQVSRMWPDSTEQPMSKTRVLPSVFSTRMETSTYYFWNKTKRLTKGSILILCLVWFKKAIRTKSSFKTQSSRTCLTLLRFIIWRGLVKTSRKLPLLKWITRWTEARAQLWLSKMFLITAPLVKSVGTLPNQQTTKRASPATRTWIQRWV